MAIHPRTILEIGFWHATLFYGVFMVSFKTIISYYRKYIAKYKRASSPCLFLWAGVLISGSILPVYSQKIIDVISLESAVQNKEAFLMVLFIKLALLILAYNLFLRAADFFMLFSKQYVEDLRNYAFDKTTEHSLHLFSNNFAGSLVAKMKKICCFV